MTDDSPRYEATRRGIYQDSPRIGVAWAESPALATRIADALNGSEALLEALENCLSLVELKFDDTDATGDAVMKQARAAIASATPAAEEVGG